jgi:hypothetical protein
MIAQPELWRKINAMTKLQELTEKRRTAKHQMFIHRPLRGYLGNQYHYWYREWNKARNEINKLKIKNPEV